MTPAQAFIESAQMSSTRIEIDEQLRSYVLGLRRWFHKHPEPGFAEHKTQARIMEELAMLGIEHRKAAKTGVVGTIHGAGKGRTIALRAASISLALTSAGSNACRP